jgi:hypothetical protein
MWQLAKCLEELQYFVPKFNTVRAAVPSHSERGDSERPGPPCRSCTRHPCRPGVARGELAAISKPECARRLAVAVPRCQWDAGGYGCTQL